MAAATGTGKRKVVKRTNKPLVVTKTQLHAYVPDKSVAEKYCEREIHGVYDATIADVAIKEKKNILLIGDTGSGKTMFGEAYAAHNEMMYYSLPCDVSIDPTALFGRMQPTEEAGKFKWQDGPVTQVVRHGGVLNISEINFMPPKISASLYPLLDGRRYVPLLGHEGEVVRAHPQLLIIADMNPNYRGTLELNQALKNRFDFKIAWGYDRDVEERLVASPTLLTIAEKVRALRGTEVHTPLSTNMMMEFEEFVIHPDLGMDFAIFNFIQAFDVEERSAIDKVIGLHRSDLDKDVKFIKARAAAKEEDEEDLEEVGELTWSQG